MSTWAIERERRNPPHAYKGRLSTIEELRSWLAQLRSEKDSNFFLTDEDTEDELTVLMDEPFAAVSFARGSDRVPLSASLDPGFEAGSDDDYHEFIMGDTPTPVSKDRCISFDLMQRVLEDVFASGTLPGWIAWRQP